MRDRLQRAITWTKDDGPFWEGGRGCDGGAARAGSEAGPGTGWEDGIGDVGESGQTRKGC